MVMKTIDSLFIGNVAVLLEFIVNRYILSSDQIS